MINTNISPLVSIVIPSYNHGHFIGRALRSVLNQTFTNWEAIVVDNHSKDDTDHVVQDFDDSRISLLKIHNNGIIAASRNVGIQAARGDWIAFLDSDDWWSPDKLQYCFKNMSENRDILYHDLRCVTEDGRPMFLRRCKSRALGENPYIDLIENGNAIPNSSVIVRKALLEDVGYLSEERGKVAWEDFDCWIRLARTGCRFFRINKRLGSYLVSTSNTSNPSLTLKNIDSFINEYIRPSQYSENCNLPWWTHYSSAISYVGLKEYEQAKKHFCKAWDLADNWSDRARILVNRAKVLFLSRST